MKQFLVTLFISIATSSAMAGMAIYQPIGSNTVLGGYGNRHALSTALGNPASSYLMANLQGFRVNFLGPLSIGLEAGAGPGLEDRVEALEALVEGDFPSGLSTIEADATSVALTAIQDSLDEFNVGYIAAGGVTSPQDYDGNTYELPDQNPALGGADATDVANAINTATTQAEADATAATDAFVATKISDVKTEIEEVIDEVNGLLSEVGETTFVKFSTSIQAPFLPIIYKTRRRGVFTVDASASIVGRASLLADSFVVKGLDPNDPNVTGLGPLDSITSAADLAAFDFGQADFESDMSLYLKRASDYKFSLGYSEMVSRTEDSAVIYGGRLNFHKLALDRKLTVLSEDGESSVSYESLIDHHK